MSNTTETVSGITVNLVAGPTDLHCQYEGQSDRQPCYVELDCAARRLSASYNSEIGAAIPASVYHGHERRYEIPCLTTSAANQLLREIAPLAARVCDGYDSVWDGGNWVAELNDDAQQAEDEIIDAIAASNWGENHQVEAWDAEDWLGADHDAQRAEFGITATTTDAELAAIERRLLAELENNQVIYGLPEALEALRDEVRE